MGSVGEKITIYDIAKEAGTSTSTVSRVLNRSSLVTGPTADTVLAAARRLGYAPRRIRRQVSRAMLNVVVFLPHAERPQTHLFYDAATLISGIQSGFGDIRSNLIVSLSDSTDALTAKKLGDIDGCIFAFSSPTAGVRALLSDREVPTVMINRVDHQFSFVANDANAGVRALIQEIRKRRPGQGSCFVSVEDARPVADYRVQALGAAGFGSNGPRLTWFPSVAHITTSEIERLYDDGIRVFMCVNDYVAIAVSDRLMQLGLSVPGDVGVTGYDAAPVRALFSRPITTVDLSVARLGEQAAGLLSGMMVDRSSERTQMFVTGPVVPGCSL